MVGDDSFPSDDSFQALANGATRYALTGTGKSGALIDYDGDVKLVTGTCNMNVDVGGGAGMAQTWRGTFALGNSDLDALDFDATGSLLRTADPRERLNGTVTPGTYSVTVNGSTFNPASVDSAFRGGPVGPGANPTTMSGLTGEYSIRQSGPALTINGVFGSDVSAP